MRVIHSTACMGRTTVSVSEEIADRLHDLKQRGESYDDVLRRVLAEREALQERVDELEERVDDTDD